MLLEKLAAFARSEEGRVTVVLTADPTAQFLKGRPFTA